MNKRNLKSTILAVAMVVVMSIGGIMAYFTDFEEVTNNFTYGEVEIELDEPAWKPVEATEIVPNETFLKNPMVTNSSKTPNDAFVFIEIEIPYAEIITAGLDGKLVDGDANTEGIQPADTELFLYKEWQAADWVELEGTINGVTYPTKDTTKKTVTHLFVYGTANGDSAKCTKLAKGETTSPVISAVTVCNAIEAQGLEKLAVQIDVRSYAIQAENLIDVTVGTGKPEGSVDAKAIWAIILNQGTTAND